MASDKFMATAVKKPGSFTASAKRAGKGVHEYAEEEKHAPGITGKRARLALVFEKAAKGRKYEGLSRKK